MLTFRHDNEKPLRQAFQNLRGQIQSAREALRPRFGGYPDRRVGQLEPQHREPFPLRIIFVFLSSFIASPLSDSLRTKFAVYLLTILEHNAQTELRSLTLSRRAAVAPACS
jgi:hypothetical protein